MKLITYTALSLTLAITTTGLKAETNQSPVIGEITVTNNSDFARIGEMVQIEANSVEHKIFIADRHGREIPSQFTHDGFLIFQADVPAGSRAVYSIHEGPRADYDTVAYGRFVPERADDFAWENDYSAYRAYGPALQRKGEKAFGYDVWTKSVAYPIINRRYADNRQGKSFHIDHGDGMDVYTVGPTLGCGTAGIINEDGQIIYPWCFERYEILDQGPLRVSFRLYYPGETRTITLDAGSNFNRTEVRYHGHTETMTVAPGLVLHHPLDGAGEIPMFMENLKGVAMIGYGDPTDKRADNLGTIFVGVITPGDNVHTELLPLTPAVGPASGHLLTKTEISPTDTLTYYWGANWSKATVPDMTSWKKVMTDFAKRITNPLTVSLKTKETPRTGANDRK